MGLTKYMAVQLPINSLFDGDTDTIKEVLCVY